jgi:hypothetical protein
MMNPSYEKLVGLEGQKAREPLVSLKFGGE